MKCQILFSGKYMEKIITILSSAKLAERVVKLKKWYIYVILVNFIYLLFAFLTLVLLIKLVSHAFFFSADQITAINSQT